VASRRRARGLTLGELMVVLVVVGILTGLAAPRFLRSQTASRLDGDAAKLSNDVQWTRLLAAKSSMRSFLYLEGGARRWSLWLDKDRNMLFSAAADSLVKRDSLSNGVRFGLGFAAPATISVLGSSVPASGFGAVSAAAVEHCREGVAYPASPAVAGTWAKGASNGLVVGCGGSTALLGNGTLYLSASNYDDKAYAIVFNTVTAGVESFAVRRYKWTKGGTWILQ
jgi:prepilin-type N-terminal cleavage/methylation domain-containing protein